MREVKREENHPQTPVPKAREKTSSFAKEDALRAWEQFKEQRRNLGNDKEVNIMSQEFELDQQTIILQLTNPIQSDILDDFKADLLEFLRDELQNDKVSLKVNILTQDEKKMIYTNKEKFEHMAEKNPHLKTLQQKFGLDPDL